MLICVLLVVVPLPLPLPFEILKLNMYSSLQYHHSSHMEYIKDAAFSSGDQPRRKPQTPRHQRHVGFHLLHASVSASVRPDPCHDNEAAQEQRDQQQQHGLLLLAACGPGWSLGIKKNSS